MDAEYGMLKRAVLNRAVIACVYKSFERELCLHAIGMKNGRAHVLAWQIGGKSWRTMPKAGDWRAIPIAQMGNISVRQGEWRRGTVPAPDHLQLDLVDVVAPDTSSRASSYST